MSDQIIDIVISVFPSILSIFTMAGVVFKCVHEFAKLKKTVTDMKAIEDLKSEMKQVIHENAELKKTLNETLMKIDHVERSNHEKIN